jgi:alkaline phosphatase
MSKPSRAHPRLSALVAALLCSAADASLAASSISRLTPPSDPSLAPAVVISRFLPGQRFDLQATVQPDAGLAVTSVVFSVDGAAVTPAPGTSSLVTTGLSSGLAAGTAVASVRAYSNQATGLHTLRATATLSDGSTVVREGNFEIVGTTPQGSKVKNIIILLGDGMGAAHRTAARIVSQGYAQGKAKGRLAMDTFPITGMVMTSSLNSIVTDSAPGMSNYVSGNKAQNNQEGVWPDDTADAFDNPRFEYLSEYLHRLQGKALGIVTTADVFDATPAANAVHTSNRGAGTGIVDQYLDDRGLTGLTVLMGGGRKWFLPNSTNAVQPVSGVYNLVNGSQRTSATDYVLPSDIISGWGAAPGAKDNNRDLIADFQAAGFAYASDKASLDSATTVTPDKLLGLFAFSNMNVSMDKIGKRRGQSTVVDDYGFPDQPMLDEMAGAALKVLAKNPAGFVAMIEGASIDKQAHLMDTDRWILEAIEFDHAVQVAKDFALAHPDTLVIVTADHECSGAAIIGASTVSAAQLAANAAATPTGTGTKTSLMRDGSPDAVIPPGGTPANPVVGNYDAAKFPAYSNSADGFPATTDINNKMLVGYGANADRYETWLSNPKPTQDSQQPFVKPGTNNPYPNLSTYPANPSVRNSATGFFITGQVPGDQAVHTATDIPLSALGLGAPLFSGVMDNTEVFFKLGQAAIGGALSASTGVDKVSATPQEQCLFNWAEKAYPSLFAPAGASSQVQAPYTYRYYEKTNAYVAVSSSNNHVYYLGSAGVLQDQGELSGWLAKAGCQ